MKIKCIKEHQLKNTVFKKGKVYDVDEATAAHLLPGEDFVEYKPKTKKVSTTSLDKSSIKTQVVEAKEKELA